MTTTATDTTTPSSSSPSPPTTRTLSTPSLAYVTITAANQTRVHQLFHTINRFDLPVDSHRLYEHLSRYDPFTELNVSYYDMVATATDAILAAASPATTTQLAAERRVGDYHQVATNGQPTVVHQIVQCHRGDTTSRC